MAVATIEQDLKGKVALVTGATAGIGLETASALAARGARVILGCRNVDAAKKVADTIRSRTPGAQVDVPATGLDLMSQDSVRAFAAEVDKTYPQIHILVNNAGVALMKRCATPDGVGGLAQTNHLGPYTLTRLLEKKLVQSKARVVTVSSVKHRTVVIKSPRDFLMDWRAGYYEYTKLANVYFAYELQRRLGLRGVTSCVADPGGVKSNIWETVPMFKKGFKKVMLDACFSPPWDGAKPVIHAATVSWQKGQRQLEDGRPINPAEDLRYYSRGLFNNAVTTGLDGRRGKGTKWSQHLLGIIWGLFTLFVSLLDWPLRKVTRGKLASTTRAVRSSTASYDAKKAAELWEVSAELAKLPVQLQL